MNRCASALRRAGSCGELMTGAEDLHDALAFDEPVPSALDGGVTLMVWTERHTCRAKILYARGSEVVEAARLAGRSIYRARIRQCAAARAIDQTWRMRDLRRGLPDGEPDDTLPGARYAVLEVDAITDRQWIYLVVEAGARP